MSEYEAHAYYLVARGPTRRPRRPRLVKYLLNNASTTIELHSRHRSVHRAMAEFMRQRQATEMTV